MGPRGTTMASRGLISYTHTGKQSIALQTASGQLLYDMYDKHAPKQTLYTLETNKHTYTHIHVMRLGADG